MNNVQFNIWAKDVRFMLNRQIEDYACQTGYYPDAIIAGGEYWHAIRSDIESIQLLADGGCMWKGFPLIRCSGNIKIQLVSERTDVFLPELPEEEQT